MKGYLIFVAALLSILFAISCKGETLFRREDDDIDRKLDRTKHSTQFVLKRRGWRNRNTNSPYHTEANSRPSLRFVARKIKSAYSQPVNSNRRTHGNKVWTYVRKARKGYMKSYRKKYKRHMIRQHLHKRRIRRLRKRFRRRAGRRRTQRRHHHQRFRKRYRSTFNRQSVYSKRRRILRKRFRKSIYRRRKHRNLTQIAKRFRKHNARQKAFIIARRSRRIRGRFKKYSNRLQRYGSRIGRFRKRFQRRYVQRISRFKRYRKHHRRQKEYIRQRGKHRKRFRKFRNKYLNFNRRKILRKKSRYDQRRRQRNRRFSEGERSYKRNWSRAPLFHGKMSFNQRNISRMQGKMGIISAHRKRHNLSLSHRWKHGRNKIKRNRAFQRRKYIYKRHFILRHYSSRTRNYRRGYVTKNRLQYRNKYGLYKNRFIDKYPKYQSFSKTRNTSKRHYILYKEVPSSSTFPKKKRLQQNKYYRAGNDFYSHRSDEGKTGLKQTYQNKQTYVKSRYGLRTQYKLPSAIHKQKMYPGTNPKRRILPFADKNQFLQRLNYYHMDEDDRGELNNYQKFHPLLKVRSDSKRQYQYLTDIQKRTGNANLKTRSHSYGLERNSSTSSRLKLKVMKSKQYVKVKQRNYGQLIERERKETEKTTTASTPHRWILEET